MAVAIPLQVIYGPVTHNNSAVAMGAISLQVFYGPVTHNNSAIARGEIFGIFFLYTKNGLIDN